MEVRDLVEDWIAIRSTLSRQLAALKAGQVAPDDAISEATAQATIAQLEGWIGGLNALLKTYASIRRA